MNHDLLTSEVLQYRYIIMEPTFRMETYTQETTNGHEKLIHYIVYKNINISSEF
jgi:hypothetical protein